MQILKLNPRQDLTIFAGKLIDGTGTKIINNAVIEVKKGNIISRQKDVDFATYNVQNSQKVDLTNLTVLPGLIDCHVHYALNSHDLYEAIDSWDNIDLMQSNIKNYSRDFLTNGVVAVRDGSDRGHIGLRAMEMVTSGEYQGPHIMATGEAIYKKGRYGSFLGPGIRDISEVKAEIEKIYGWGAGQLKVAQSGLVSFKEYGKVGAAQFSREELTQIVEIAHSIGLPVMVHASGAEAVSIAVEAGVDSIEHGYFVQKGTLEMMAQKGIAWIPTLAPLGNLIKTGHLYEGALVEVIDKTLREHMAKVKEAWEMGVLLGVGTDAGAIEVAHGFSYHQELLYYQEAGLNPSEIIKAATANSARVLGWHEMLGTVEAGKIPFIIAVQGNPLEDLNALGNVEFVLI